MHTHIAKIVREKRLALVTKITEVELSKRLNCEDSFIERVESGECSIFPKLLRPLCKELDVSPEEIVEAIIQDQKASIEKSSTVKAKIGKKFSVDLTP